MQSMSFRVLGFRVEVRPTFLILLGVFLLFQLQGGRDWYLIVSWPVVVFASIVLHELGHALMCRWLGVRVVGAIQLHGLGGHVRHDRTHPRRQLAISLAGPFAGLLLGGVVVLLAMVLPVDQPEVAEVVRQILWVNIGWSLINLLPMMPLDGGNAWRSALALVTSERNAWRIAAMTGLVLGLTVMAVSYSQNLGMFLVLIGGYVAYQNYQLYQQVA